MWLAVAGVVGLYWLGAVSERRRRALDAQLTGIPVDDFGRVLGVDGKPVADRLILSNGRVFDPLAFAREVDARLAM